MATSRKGGGAKPPPPHDVPKPPAPRPVASATKPPPVAGGGKTSKEGKVTLSKKQKGWGIAVFAALAGGAIWYGFFYNKSSQTAPTTAQVAPIVTPAPAPTPSPPAVAQPAPVVAPTPPPTAPAAPPPAPTLSAEEVDKRIAALTDGDEVKGCLARLKSWGVDISTPSAFDSEATNCRGAVAAK